MQAGIVATLLASKFVERWAPEVSLYSDQKFFRWAALHIGCSSCTPLEHWPSVHDYICMMRCMSRSQVNDFVYICDRTYSKQQILGAEQTMVNVLQFRFAGAHLQAASGVDLLSRPDVCGCTTSCPSHQEVMSQPAAKHNHGTLMSARRSSHRLPLPASLPQGGWRLV